MALLRRTVEEAEIDVDSPFVELIPPSHLRWDRTKRAEAKISTNDHKDAVRKALQALAHNVRTVFEPGDDRGYYAPEANLWVRLYGPRKVDRHDTDSRAWFRATFTVEESRRPDFHPDIIESTLPPLPQFFVGRERLLGNIANRVRGTGSAMLTLWGLPGCGKTVLAVALARTLSREFPDRQLLVDLSNVWTANALFRSVLARFTTQVPATDDTETLRAYAYEGLRGLRGVMVLDGIPEMFDGIEKFSPPPGWMFILTSRTLLPLSDARSTHVGGLTPDGARQLLLAMTERTAAPPPMDGMVVASLRHLGRRRKLTPDTADLIAHLCDYLPGFLRNVALRLTTFDDDTWDQVLRPLCGISTRFHAIGKPDARYTDAFEELYAGLLPEEKRAYQRMAVLGDSFDIRTAALVTYLDTSELSSLSRRGLLERSSRTGRYRMPIVARSHAYGLLVRNRAAWSDASFIYLRESLREMNLSTHALIAEQDPDEAVAVIGTAASLATADDPKHQRIARDVIAGLLEGVLEDTSESERFASLLMQDQRLVLRLLEACVQASDRAAGAILCFVGGRQRDRALLRAAATCSGAAPAVRQAALRTSWT